MRIKYLILLIILIIFNFIYNMIYDCAVIGLGINGSSALYNLTKNGYSCIAFEKNDISQNKASSQGPTRIIRKAYFESADYYQKLITRGYDLWKEIEEKSSTKLFENTGVIFVDNPDGTILPEILKAQEKYKFDCKKMNIDQLEDDQKFFKIKNRNCISLIDNTGGILYADKCIKELLRLSISTGNVKINDNTKVVDVYKKDKNYYILDSNNNTYQSKYIIISTGSWIDSWLKSFSTLSKYRPFFRIENALVTYIKFKKDEYNSSDHLKRPFYIGTEKHHLYGFPSIGDGNYIKLGIYKYYSNDNVLFEDEKEFDSKNFNDLLHTGKDYFRFVDINKENFEIISYSRCTYTITKDEHYVIDRIPNEENAFIISACSGHGFKFGPSIGEYVVNLIMKKEDIDPFFSLRRFDKYMNKSKF